MTHEEIIGLLLADVVSSYRELPDDALSPPDEVAGRAAVRGGLIRVREFVMKDAYSFDRDRRASTSATRPIRRLLQDLRTARPRR